MQYCKYAIVPTLSNKRIKLRNQINVTRKGSFSLKIKHSINLIQGFSFTKAFGLKSVKSSYFPHLFKMNENKNYIQLIPILKYICC